MKSDMEISVIVLHELISMESIYACQEFNTPYNWILSHCLALLCDSSSIAGLNILEDGPKLGESAYRSDLSNDN